MWLAFIIIIIIMFYQEYYYFNVLPSANVHIHPAILLLLLRTSPLNTCNYDVICTFTSVWWGVNIGLCVPIAKCVIVVCKVYFCGRMLVVVVVVGLIATCSRADCLQDIVWTHHFQTTCVCPTYMWQLFPCSILYSS